MGERPDALRKWAAGDFVSGQSLSIGDFHEKEPAKVKKSYSEILDDCAR